MTDDIPVIGAAQFADAILDSTVEGIWTVGRDGLIKTVNKAAVRLFGYQDAIEMIGRNSHELVHYKHMDGSHYPIAACEQIHDNRWTSDRDI
jgi:PAS domain S-box-containing protein